MHTPSNDELTVFVGTYNPEDSDGLFVLRWQPEAGRLVVRSALSGIANPSFLAVDAGGTRIFAVSETGGENGGTVVAVSYDPSADALRRLNARSSHGSGPCHLSVDAAGAHVLVANYSSGSAAVLPIQADGTLGDATSTVQHHGSSVHPTRQAGPHAHSITLSPDERYACVADLGLDRLMVYRYDGQAGRISAHEPAWAGTKPGAGPRHLCFLPQRPFAYLINELDSTITAFRYDADQGAFTHVQTISTLPEGYQDDNTCADIHPSPDGRFIYGSNRGHDSIAVFAVDQESGRLALVQHQSSGGKTPRNFGLSPDGAYLLAANQDSDSIVAYRRDAESGALEPTGATISIPKPVCVKIRTP